jgi:hypothetical protein
MLPCHLLQMKNNIESDFQPLGNPKSESASAHVGIIAISGRYSKMCKNIVNLLVQIAQDTAAQILIFKTE